MRPRLPNDRPATEPPAFYSVAATARILGTSEMTIYRAIADGEFPAVRIRGRLIVPAKVIDDIAKDALDGRRLVDTATWAPGDAT